MEYTNLDDFLPDDHILLLPSQQSTIIASQIAKHLVETEKTTGLFTTNFENMDMKLLENKPFSVFIVSYSDVLKQGLLNKLKEYSIGLLLTTDTNCDNLEFDYIILFPDTPTEIKKEIYDKYLKNTYKETIMIVSETIIVKKDKIITYLKL